MFPRQPGATPHELVLHHRDVRRRTPECGGSKAEESERELPHVPRRASSDLEPAPIFANRPTPSAAGSRSGPNDVANAVADSRDVDEIAGRRERHSEFFSTTLESVSNTL